LTSNSGGAIHSAITTAILVNCYESDTKYQVVCRVPDVSKLVCEVNEASVLLSLSPPREEAEKGTHLIGEEFSLIGADELSRSQHRRIQFPSLILVPTEEPVPTAIDAYTAAFVFDKKPRTIDLNGTTIFRSKFLN